MMGASNPHPHGQIWATEHIPNEPFAELASQRAYMTRHGEPLLAAYLRMELAKRERIVLENESWVALVPFWAAWPFETILLPRRAMPSFAELSNQERDGLADILQQLTAGYNRVFDAPFPYSMGFHPAPSDGDKHAEWMLHAHFLPPLLRSATVRKFMVGFELLGSPQRDVTPESAAEVLRKAMQL
jgi:UDPglucose--hexose-1-phosphate uridylyltransferase